MSEILQKLRELQHGFLGDEAAELIEELADALKVARERMQWLEDWRDGEKRNLPSCEAAITFADAVLAKVQS